MFSYFHQVSNINASSSWIYSVEWKHTLYTRPEWCTWTRTGLGGPARVSHGWTNQWCYTLPAPTAAPWLPNNVHIATATGDTGRHFFTASGKKFTDGGRYEADHVYSLNTIYFCSVSFQRIEMKSCTNRTNKNHDNVLIRWAPSSSRALRIISYTCDWDNYKEMSITR